MTTAIQNELQLGQSWRAANAAYLQTELRRLRLLLQRRVLWLRRQWQHDPLANYQGLLISEAQADWLLAGEDRQAEARFYAEDAQAAALGRDIAVIEEDLAAQATALITAGTPPALAVLAQLFDLSRFEQEVLLLCLAPEIDLGFERLYAYVQDDAARKYVTPQLALALCDADGENGHAEAASFAPQAPLRRFHLLAVEPGSLPATALLARSLRIDERIADFLRGINRPDETIAELLHPLPQVPLAPPHRELADRLAQAFAAGAGQNWLALNLSGPGGIGKRAVAQAIGDQLGLEVYRLDLRALPAPGPERQAWLARLEREAVLSQLAFYVDMTTHDPAEQAALAALEHLIERLAAFLIIGSHERWQTEQIILSVPVPKADAAAQRILWQQALDPLTPALAEQIEAIVQQFDFGPQAIAQTAAAAWGRVQLHDLEDKADLAPSDLWQACRDLAGGRMDELARRIRSGYSMADIVLPDDTLLQLQEIAAQVACRPHVYEAWGFGAKLSRGRGISALFAGPSGTGKTMAAEILANRLNLDLYRIDLAGVVSKYIGETEKNLKKVFDAAEQSGAILFFDEADALFGQRSEVKDSHDRYANIEVNYLLQRMEDYRGLAILATNRKSALDRAFLRRLRFLVDFPFPDAANRRRIWQQVFPPQVALEELDYTFLARLEIAGGNIHNIALNAAFLAAGAGRPVGMEQIMRAARREYAKIDKMISEGEFGAYYQRGRV